jgi:hypothetical protein
MKSNALLPVIAIAVSTALAACGGGEATPADSNATAVAAPVATLDGLAGDWDWVMTPEVGDSVLAKGTSRINADGTGWSKNEARADTIPFTATIVGDSAIYQSQPYTDAAMPAEVGQVTFRYAGLASMGTSGTGNLSVSPVSKPDTVLVRARVDATKR